MQYRTETRSVSTLSKAIDRARPKRLADGSFARKPSQSVSSSQAILPSLTRAHRFAVEVGGLLQDLLYITRYPVYPGHEP
jgi:hypothetical protein